ncbi:Uncharacterised protein [Burkholderia pseudomallei]|nr:Uncharacterised protein [Burkholderia pseudomallei]
MPVDTLKRRYGLLFGNVPNGLPYGILSTWVGGCYQCGA